MPKRLEMNTELFIKKANEIHNLKYEYSLSKYVNMRSKLIIICPIHGEFQQTPSHHLNRKQGCAKCFKISMILGEDKFIERSNKIHNNKFDYSLVEYKNVESKVKIICPVHGVFEQTPFSHLQGNDCLQCVNQNQTKDIETFIKEANKTHNFKYDYSNSIYVNAATKLKIICPIHGEFEQQPSNHLIGRGCKKCQFDKRKNKKFFDKCNEKFNNKYDYSISVYVNAHTLMSIICPVHGEILQKPNDHFKGIGCPYCSGIKQNTNFFIKESKKEHNNKYDYSLTKYENADKKVQIICPVHGIFEQIPRYHIKGCGCPFCNMSHGELKIMNFMDKNNINYIYQKKFDDCKYIRKLPFDFYLPDFNLCIEFHGGQHFKSVKWFGGENKFIERQRNDIIKENYCKNNKIKIIIISDIKEVKNILTKELIK